MVNTKIRLITRAAFGFIGMLDSRVSHLDDFDTIGGQEVLSLYARSRSHHAHGGHKVADAA